MPYTTSPWGWRVGSGGIPKGVKKLLVATALVYLFQLLWGDTLVAWLGLHPRLTWSRFYLWQFVTYLFLHGGLLHLVLNLYALYVFGKEVEWMWGERAFLRYYFITGIGAGIIHTLIMPHSMIPTIGASGAVAGVLAAFALMFPDQELTLFLFFILPLRMRAKTLALGYAVISLVSGAAGSPDGIAHFAHIGGMLIGYLYLKKGAAFDFLTAHLRRRRWQRRVRKAQTFDQIRRLADAVLDKANAVGFENLTRQEKAILKKAARILGDDAKYGPPTR